MHFLHPARELSCSFDMTARAVDCRSDHSLSGLGILQWPVTHLVSALEKARSHWLHAAGPVATGVRGD